MGRSKTTEMHQFYCIKCGQAGIPLARRASRQKERFHRKVLYCYHCHQDINHIECKNEEDIREFKKLFAQGAFKNEAKESVSYVRHSGIGQVNFL